MIFGPVRSFVGTVRTNIFHFSENFEWTLYFFNFSKFWSGPRTGPKKNPPRYGFFRTKIRTTDRTRFESGPNSGPRTRPTKIRTENPDHGPDQRISDQKSGPRTKFRTGPDFWYGPAVHAVHNKDQKLEKQTRATILTTLKGILDHPVNVPITLGVIQWRTYLVRNMIKVPGMSGVL